MDSSEAVQPPAAESFGVFVEVDKILIDAHNSVHRVAFNRAFKASARQSRWLRVFTQPNYKPFPGRFLELDLDSVVWLQELGHKATHWPPELFWQLLRSCAATPDSLVKTYYNT